jgi:hypothetical protein
VHHREIDLAGDDLARAYRLPARRARNDLFRQS